MGWRLALWGVLEEHGAGLGGNRGWGLTIGDGSVSLYAMTELPPKPSVFFSHASVDGEAIAVLKKRFLQITGGAIDVFVSSDGQSIRFGRNWIHEIEDALGRCKIMFVFVTPRSKDSGWIFFEAGHAYGRDIQVVPVAILGADLNALPGPLALLQGFNVKDSSGLDNIIAIVNSTFTQTHDRKFTEEDFASITGSATGLAGNFCAPYTALVAEVRLEIDLSDAPYAPSLSKLEDEATGDRLKRENEIRSHIFRKTWTLIEEHLERSGIVFAKDHDRFHLEGISLKPGHGGISLTISIEASAARRLVPIAEGIASALKPNGACAMIIGLVGAVSGERQPYRVTGRLSSDGATVVPKPVSQWWGTSIPAMSWRGNEFVFGFASSKPASAFVATTGVSFDLDWAEALVKLLFERRILFLE